MRSERGEGILLGVAMLLILSGLFLLTTLELEAKFRLLQKRTTLFLCVKESKEEMRNFLSFMGKTNWALENLDKAKLFALLIPGAQGASLKAAQLKKLIMRSQDVRLPLYLKNLMTLKLKGCPIPPDLFQTPFHLSGQGFIRNNRETTILRSAQWQQNYILHPYLLTMKVDARNYLGIKPALHFHFQEKEAKQSFLSSFRWQGPP